MEWVKKAASGLGRYFLGGLLVLIGWFRGLPRLWWSRLRDLWRPKMAYWLMGWVWFVYAGLWAVLVSLREVIHSAMFALLSMEDAPPIEFVYSYYEEVYWSAGAAGGALLLGLGWSFRHGVRKPGRERVLLGALVAHLCLFLLSCRFSFEAEWLVAPAVGFTDWLGLALVPVFVWATLTRLRTSFARKVDVPEAHPRTLTLRVVSRKAIIYCLSGVTVFLYAIPSHLKFWEHAEHDGFKHMDVIPASEVADGDVVLFTTSMLFASVAALAALAAYALYRRSVGGKAGRTQALSDATLLRLSLALAFAWAFAAVVPYAGKAWPEIASEDGYIFPAIMLTVLLSTFAFMLHGTLLYLREDTERAAQGRAGLPHAELSVLAFVLWPFYVFLRPLRSRSGRLSAFMWLVLAAVLTHQFFMFIDDVDINFFDFKDILEDTVVPFMQVYLALVIAWFIYIGSQRLGWVLGAAGRWVWEKLGRQPGTPRAVVLGLTGGIYALTLCCGLMASAPFWYWDEQGIKMNTHARLVEYSSRHEFEIRFLHGLLDFDLDGYSSFLHGGDPDDFDASVTPQHLGPLDPIDLAVDRFEVTDAIKAKGMPNVMVLTLEGVTRKALSIYGERRLAEGRVATPHIDAIAREGSVFTNARAAYPSTWDAWLMINSGRYIRVTEMDAAISFGDRYGRHNNLNKVMKAVGTNRWCHANAAAYSKMIVGEDRHTLNWEDDLNTSASDEQSEQGIYRGDNNIKRVERFLDSLQPGDRFFLSEHMADTHFPWLETSLERAQAMGFEDGLAWTGVDAIPTSQDHINYFSDVTRMDWQIGQMVAALKDKGLYDNTAIIIMSDHGCQWTDHGHMYYPGHLYDQALRIPLIIKVPGIEGWGQFIDAPVIQMDLLSTLMDLAGVSHVQAEGTAPLPGCSLLPWMTGKETPNMVTRCAQRDMLATTHYDMVGYIEDFRYKLIVDRPVGTFLLFDLETDPRELHNLADSRPMLLQRLILGMGKAVDRHPSFLAGINR